MALERSQRYDLLAALFNYPHDGSYHELLNRSIEGVGQDWPAAVEPLMALSSHTAGLSLEQIQELYTRTFDINPVCTLEIGWHIYGEDYARGALLVKLRQKIREVNLVESVELPDHLTHVLALLGRVCGDEADELASRYILPALDKMLAAMSDGDYPYLSILKAVRMVVQFDHDVEAVLPREKRQDPPDFKNRLPMFSSQSCGRGGDTRGNR